MAATPLMSFAEFERLDQGPDHLELLRGEVIREPLPYFVHMQICERLFERLKTAVERLRQSGHGDLGNVHIEMGYIFPTVPASWLRPDVSLTHPGQLIDRFYVGAPLIAFEVVSESDTAPQLDEKVSEYFANGAAEVWLIYPNRRHAWVYEGSGSARNETNRIVTPLLPGIEIPFSEIF